MCEAGLSRRENPYGLYRGLRWSLIFITLWILRSSRQHTCNFPVTLPSCLELWVMCFKSASEVWTRPAGVSIEMWDENEKTSEWERVERRHETAESNVRTEQKLLEDLRSKVCSLIPQRNATRSIWVKLYRQHLWRNTITTENYFDWSPSPWENMI